MSLQGLFGIVDYILYLVQSTNRHGVHSPFVYHFTDKVLYGNMACEFEPSAELCRKRMIQSKRKLVIDSAHVSLSRLSASRIPIAKYNRLLFRWVQDQQLGNHIIEVGSSLGVMPLYLQRGDAGINRYSVFDKNEAVLKITAFNTKEYDCKEPIAVCGYQKVAEITLQIEQFHPMPIDLLIINERLEATEFWSLVEWAIPRLSEHGSIVMTTIRAHEDQLLSWEQLKNQPEITVGIDLFGMGMAFARKSQEKENFLLRY